MGLHLGLRERWLTARKTVNATANRFKYNEAFFNQESNEMSEQNTNNESILIEDLNVQEADGIKGGTREHVLLARQVDATVVLPASGTTTAAAGFKPGKELQNYP